MTTFTQTNLLTFDEGGSGKLVELARADGLPVNDYGLGNADLTYACLAQFLSALLIYGKDLFGGAIRIVRHDSTGGDDWIPATAIADINALEAAGLFVSSVLSIVYVQQVAATDPSFKVRIFDLLGSIRTVVCEFPTGLGTGSPVYEPVGGWQNGIALLGCAISADASKLYVMTKQYLCQFDLPSGAASTLVDFGGAALAGCGGLACRPADGRIFAGLVELVTVGAESYQRYLLNQYAPDGSLVQSDPVAQQEPLPSPAANFSFGPHMRIGNGGNDLWWFLEDGEEDPVFVDTASKLRENVFHDEDVLPPDLVAWGDETIPGAVGRLSAATGVAKWVRLVA